jgi:hypothetical protein
MTTGPRHDQTPLLEELCQGLSKRRLDFENGARPDPRQCYRFWAKPILVRSFFSIHLMDNRALL